MSQEHNTVDVEQVVRNHITASPHLSLATVKENKPWVCEVHFAYDEDLSLYFVSQQDTRHCQEIALNPYVAGNIIKQHPLTEAPNGIYFEGRAERIKASADKINLYCNAFKRDATQLTEQLKGSGDLSMYRIKVTKWAVFGNFDGKEHAKHTLEWAEV